MVRSGMLFFCLGMVAACGDDPECLIDSDCPELFHICQSDQCVPRGALDAGLDGAGLDATVADGGMDAAVDAGPEDQRLGTVVASQTPVAADPPSSPHHLTASFVVVDEGAGCATMDMGGCRITECLIAAPPADAGAADAGAADAGIVVAPHAGAISVVADVSLTATPGADGVYPAVTGNGLLWSTGAAVTVSGEGADVPAFSSSLEGPGQATVTTPSFMMLPLMIDRASDFTVGWADGATGTVEVMLWNQEPTATGTRSVSAKCGFDAASGTSGVVPAAVLERIPTGPGGAIAIRSVAGELVEPGGGWQVTVEIQTTAVADTGSAASGSVTVIDSTM